MTTTRFVLSLALASIALAACPPAPTNTPDGSAQDASTQDASALGSAFCAKLSQLACPVAPRCGRLIDPVTSGTPAQCIPQWNAFLRCLDQSAPSIQCAQVPESGQPLVCADELRAADQCYLNTRDAEATPDASEPEDSGPTAAIGIVNVTVLYSPTSQLVGVSAERPAPADSCTTVAREGACSYRTCAEPPLPMLIAMGDVTFTNGDNTTTMQPNDMGVYGTSRVTWAAGTTTMVSGAGGNGVPAFSQAISMPTSFVTPTLRAPMRDADVDRSSDLVAQFTAENFGAANIVVAAGNQHVRCSTAPSAGTVTIPSALLARLPAGPATINVSNERESVQRSAGWDVRTVVANGGETAPITLR